MPRAPALLIVDDEPDMLDLLRIFASEAFPAARIVGAASGEAALVVIAAAPPDVVLCDFRMPGMDGIELLRRCAVAAPRARRVLMTAYADSGLEALAQEAGVEAFLRKPLDPEQLLALLRRLLAA
ncbi:MAG: hypothetical protein QOI63_628 [Thermoplasmata archaeon]|jgi:CheY-like chemotaxis protein|nr:hypothetical protein [Thermoplasmata archaeon]